MPPSEEPSTSASKPAPRKYTVRLQDKDAPTLLRQLQPATPPPFPRLPHIDLLRDCQGMIQEAFPIELDKGPRPLCNCNTIVFPPADRTETVPQNGTKLPEKDYVPSHIVYDTNYQSNISNLRNNNSSLKPNGTDKNSPRAQSVAFSEKTDVTFYTKDSIIQPGASGLKSDDDIDADEKTEFKVSMQESSIASTNGQNQARVSKRTPPLILTADDSDRQEQGLTSKNVNSDRLSFPLQTANGTSVGQPVSHSAKRSDEKQSIQGNTLGMDSQMNSPQKVANEDPYGFPREEALTYLEYTDPNMKFPRSTYSLGKVARDNKDCPPPDPPVSNDNFAHNLKDKSEQEFLQYHLNMIKQLNDQADAFPYTFPGVMEDHKAEVPTKRKSQYPFTQQRMARIRLPVCVRPDVGTDYRSVCSAPPDVSLAVDNIIDFVIDEGPYGETERLRLRQGHRSGSRRPTVYGMALPRRL